MTAALLATAGAASPYTADSPEGADRDGSRDGSKLDPATGGRCLGALLTAINRLRWGHLKFAGYWVAILTPAGGGTLRFRDRCCRGGGTSLTATSAATDRTALPNPWATDRQFKDGRLSVFGSD
jgi:hypothetical protein